MKTRHLSQLPKAYAAYPKIIRSLIQKSATKGQELPQVEYVVDQVQIDPVHLAKYKQVCHFPSNGLVPTTYLAVLSQSLQMHMMTREAFPFAILGLVHVRNQVKQYRPILINEIFSISCKFGETQPHEKGILFDFVVTVYVAGEVVCEAVMTYLSRQKSSHNANKSPVTPPDYHVQDTWEIPENIGRRYALISGDLNLIHLHALTAKAFGFNQAIAHGMWSKARALAALSPLPNAYEADVWFKLPMFLPSKVEFLTVTQGNTTEFLIQNADSQKPHLAGKLVAF